LKSNLPKTFNIAVAGARYFLSKFVEDVEVVREACRVGSGIQDDATGKMTFLAPVRSENG
jgi:hypothetical protein